VVVGSDEVASAEVEPSDRDAHRRGVEELRSALGVLEGGKLGLAQADLTVALLAVALLRVWSRWLRSMANASPARLLDAFIRRPGRVACDASTVTVWLDRHPLDVILQMAGYTATTDAIAWLHGRRVRLVLGGGRP
jgi:hypothetical protein